MDYFHSDAPLPEPRPPRPLGVGCLVIAGCLGGALAAWGACLYFSTGYPLGGLLFLVLGLAAAVLAYLLFRGCRSAYLISLALASLALALDLVWLIGNLVTPDESEMWGRGIETVLSIMLSIPLAALLLVHLGPGVRAFFRRSPPSREELDREGDGLPPF